MDASNLLKPALANGELRCIGSTTYQEYKASSSGTTRSRGASRRSTSSSLRVTETIQILKGLQAAYEEHHGVDVHRRRARSRGGALGQAHQRSPPAGQGHRRDRRGRRAPARSSPTTSASSIVDVADDRGGGGARSPASRRRASPPPTTSAAQPRARAASRSIFGQDAAIEALASAIKLSRSGLRHRRKPDRQLPLLRPHRRRQDGAGQAARAHAWACQLLRFDMTEYMEKHTVSRLIGAPPGYVGFDQGGLLTDAIRKQPHRGAAARRDREGAPRRLQHPAPGDGPRAR